MIVMRVMIVKISTRIYQEASSVNQNTHALDVATQNVNTKMSHYSNLNRLISKATANCGDADLNRIVEEATNLYIEKQIELALRAVSRPIKSKK